MICENLKHYLDKKGIKYTYIAKKTNISMNLLSPTLNGKRKLTAEEFFLICEAINEPLEKFLDKNYKKEAG